MKEDSDVLQDPVGRGESGDSEVGFSVPQRASV